MQDSEPEPEPKIPEEDIPVPPSIPKVEDKDIKEDLRTELRELATDCEEQGIKIDKHTGRKNNSRKIAEIVFKIAKTWILASIIRCFISALPWCTISVSSI